MIGKFISINQVLSKVVRDLGLTDQIPYQDMIEWIAEGMQFIGGFEQYEIKCCTIDICDHEGELPCDFYKQTFNQNNPPAFQTNDGSSCRVEFKVQNQRILTNIRDGKLYLEYLAIPLDCDGYPLIPDDESYKTALFWYVAKMLALRGELPGNLQLGTGSMSNFVYCHSRWDRYCGQARTQANSMGVDATQRRANEYAKLIPDTQEYYKRFVDLGKVQLLNRDIR